MQDVVGQVLAGSYIYPKHLGLGMSNENVN